MSETTPTKVVFEKPKAVWVVGAWLSSLAAVLGAGMTGIWLLYGAVFAALVGAWAVFGVGRPWTRQRRMAFVILCIWTLTVPLWLSLVERVVMSLSNRGVVPSVSRVDLVLAALAWLMCLISGTLAGLITMHRRTTLVCALASLLAVALLLDHQSAMWASAGAWHATVMGAIVLWAVGARTRRLSGSHCAGCGYDLAGTEGPVCPECGRARVTAAAPALKA